MNEIQIKEAEKVTNIIKEGRYNLNRKPHLIFNGLLCCVRYLIYKMDRQEKEINKLKQLINKQ